MTAKTPAKTPTKTPGSAKKFGSTTGGKQSNILSFFGKKSATTTPSAPVKTEPVDVTPTPAQKKRPDDGPLPALPKFKKPFPLESSPPASSDGPDPETFNPRRKVCGHGMMEIG